MQQHGVIYHPWDITLAWQTRSFPHKILYDPSFTWQTRSYMIHLSHGRQGLILSITWKIEVMHTSHGKQINKC